MARKKIFDLYVFMNGEHVGALKRQVSGVLSFS